jgi:hypothetical protein
LIRALTPSPGAILTKQYRVALANMQLAVGAGSLANYARYLTGFKKTTVKTALNMIADNKDKNNNDTDTF